MKFKSSFVFVFFIFFSQLFFAQPTPKHTKGSVYFLWGYNRDYYSKSTLHFKNNGNAWADDATGSYDFVVKDVSAHDRPQFEEIYDIKNITIPQFSTRLGYYFNNSADEGIEINYDHAKYIVDDWQTVRFQGQIFGRDIDKDSLLNPKFFHFEHSDGANFWNVNYLKRWNLNKSASSKHNYQLVVKTGGGIVLPRTDATLFGKRVNNDWKVAGVCVNVETGFRSEFWKKFVCELTAKGLAVDYISCFVSGKGNGKATHRFLAAELIFAIGWQFNRK